MNYIFNQPLQRQASMRRKGAKISLISLVTTDEGSIQCGVWALPGCAEPDIGWAGVWAVCCICFG